MAVIALSPVAMAVHGQAGGSAPLAPPAPPPIARRLIGARDRVRGEG